MNQAQRCIHEPLAASPDGLSCSACGYVWQAPYFLRTVIAKWDRSGAEFEAKMEAKRMKKEAKTAHVEGVVISPSVAAYFTDDPDVIGPKLGQLWKCEKCRTAPRRHPDFANTWKWKTEKGWREHKCKG